MIINTTKKTLIISIDMPETLVRVPSPFDGFEKKLLPNTNIQVLLNFFAGTVFPIDVLPDWLVRIIYLTPFPYLAFVPLKVWLEHLTIMMTLKAVLISFAWLVFFYWLARFLWQKGAKSYEAYGG